jgi:integrase
MANRRNFDFFIHAPNKHGRRSFAIIQRQGKVSKTLKLPELDAINKNFKEGVIDYNVAVDLVEKLKNRLYEQHKPDKFVHNENVDLLKKYWAHKYEHKDIKARSSAYSRLRRAIEALEGLSLLTSSQYDIQAKISKHPRQRTIAAALNQMLIFSGRKDVRIPLNRKIRKKPRYLTPAELDIVLSHITGDHADTMKLLCRVAIATGLRVGEIFALTRSSLREEGDGLYIIEQMEKSGVFDVTKTREDRFVPILLSYKKDVLRWVTEIPMALRLEIRTIRHAEVLKEACMKVFPDNEDKHCVFHDLRHSYAAEMLRLGYGIDIVARCLGNSLQVCQEYYAGFTLSQNSLTAVIHQMRRQQSGH